MLRPMSTLRRGRFARAPHPRLHYGRGLKTMDLLGSFRNRLPSSSLVGDSAAPMPEQPSPRLRDRPERQHPQRQREAMFSVSRFHIDGRSLARLAAGIALSSGSVRRHADFRSSLLQPGVEFFDHLRRPLCVDLSWSVPSLAQHHVSPFVNQVIQFCFVGEFFR